MIFDSRQCVTFALRVFLLLSLITATAVAPAQEVVLSLNTTNTSVVAGSSGSFWLNVLNPSSQTAAWSFPDIITAKIIAQGRTFTNTLTIQSNSGSSSVTIASGTFARREYLLSIPTSVAGKVIVEFTGLNVGKVLLDVETPWVASTAQTKNKSKLDRLVQDAEPMEAGKPFDPGRFFMQQISPYEPMYFIAGDEAPNAKFQISFKYQLLNEIGWLARKAPALKGFNIAYTQTSLWDLSARSTPFFDSSYKPAFIYSWDRVVGREDVDWFRLDLQGGAQHESNGKGGVDSRSQNIIFFRPTLVFGRDDNFQLTLQPRAWGYIGGLSDNPDLDEYRGYFDLRAVIGWRRGLQLSALGRMGHNGNNSSAQFDLTYPMMKIVGSFSLYLQVQYFTGYGESLLRYNQRSDVFRLGFSLYR